MTSVPYTATARSAFIPGSQVAAGHEAKTFRVLPSPLVDDPHEVTAQLEQAPVEGAAFGAVYAPDASFVTVRGEHIAGRPAIAAGHAGIFGSIYAGSVNRMELVEAKQNGDDVVVAVSFNTLECPAGPLVGRHRAFSTNVITRPAGDGGEWRIVATHNTLVTT